MEIRQIRDVTVITLDENRYLGISCDSCGGIGNKEMDVVKTEPEISARETAKVVLAELLSLGMEPLVLADGLAVEMDDTGRRIIKGFEESLEQLRTCKVHMTGSTEENMRTVQTSMGVTGVGICEKNKFRYLKTKAGDICMLAGLPLVGYDVVNNPDKVLTIRDFEEFYLSDKIKEILPVGSRGIDEELQELSGYNGLGFVYDSDLSVDVHKSAGPSCCCLLTLAKDDRGWVEKLTDRPLCVLGVFTRE